MRNAVLLTAPVPGEHEIAGDELETILDSALVDAETRRISGKQITPFLLAAMSAASKGKTIAANIALLENNARIAATVAVAMSQRV
jgi:pseudouridine-5'-phosphate glycosidase